jgi:serine phosphatase RsbU (regulator of sigma subunit)
MFLRKDGLNILLSKDRKISVYYKHDTLGQNSPYLPALKKKKMTLLENPQKINGSYVYTLIFPVAGVSVTNEGVLIVNFHLERLLLPISHGKKVLNADIIYRKNKTSVIYCFSKKHTHSLDFDFEAHSEKTFEPVSFIVNIANEKFLISKITHKKTHWDIYTIIPYSHIMRYWESTKSYLIILYVLYLAFGLIITLYKLNTITKPIKILIEGINRIEREGLDYRIDIKENNEIQILADTFNSMTSRLKGFIEKKESEKNILDDIVRERTDELSVLNKELNYKEMILKEDLEVAKQIQRSVINIDMDAANLLDISIIFEPMIEVGGDIYDITCINNDVIRIFVADASGHGVQGALSTMLIKSVYEQFKNKYSAPEKIITEMNKTFFTSYYNFNTFFSCAIYDINPKHNKITFATAGHPPHYIIDKKANVSLPDADGIVIGVVKDFKYKAVTQKFNKHDKLVLITDGVYEEFSENGEELGKEHFFDFLKTNAECSPEMLATNVYERILAWVGQNGLHDDITIITASIK